MRDLKQHKTRLYKCLISPHLHKRYIFLETAAGEYNKHATNTVLLKGFCLRLISNS